jgi:hypothetical protein
VTDSVDGAGSESRPPQGWWKHWQELSDDELVSRFDSAMDEADALRIGPYGSAEGVLEWLEMAKLARDELQSRESERLTKAALAEARAATRLAVTNTILAGVAVILALVALFLR